MADPATQTAGASIALSTATTLTAAQTTAGFFGVPPDLMVWGLVGGLVALIYAEPRQPPLTGLALAFHALGRLFSAAALGGVLSGVAMPVLAANLSLLRDIDRAPLGMPAVAVLIGASTAFLPEAFKFIRSWVNKRTSA